MNNIEITHLLTRFPAKHTQAAAKVEGTKGWVRTTGTVDPAVEEYEAGKEIVEKKVPEEIW